MSEGVQTPPFMNSQWHDCKNTGSYAIPPYGIAEVVGMTSIPVNGYDRPAIAVRQPTTNNPEKLVFVGPTGCEPSNAGICHAEAIGYAAHSGSLSTTANYGVDDGYSTLQQKSGQFRGIGGTFTSDGNNVSLFYKATNAGTKKILFTIASATTSTAIVTVNMASCNLTEIDGIGIGCTLTVYDDLGCLLNQAAPLDWVGKKGTAVLMQPISVSTCETDGTCRWVIDALCCP